MNSSIQSRRIVHSRFLLFFILSLLFLTACGEKKKPVPLAQVKELEMLLMGPVVEEGQKNNPLISTYHQAVEELRRKLSQEPDAKMILIPHKIMDDPKRLEEWELAEVYHQQNFDPQMERVKLTLGLWEQRKDRAETEIKMVLPEQGQNWVLLQGFRIDFSGRVQIQAPWFERWVYTGNQAQTNLKEALREIISAEKISFAPSKLPKTIEEAASQAEALLFRINEERAGKGIEPKLKELEAKYTQSIAQVPYDEPTYQPPEEPTPLVYQEPRRPTPLIFKAPQKTPTPPAPVKGAFETTTEFEARQKSYQAQVAEIDRNNLAALKQAKAEFEKAKQEQEQAYQARLKQSKIDFQAAQKQQSEQYEKRLKEGKQNHTEETQRRKTAQKNTRAALQKEWKEKAEQIRHKYDESLKQRTQSYLEALLQLANANWPQSSDPTMKIEAIESDQFRFRISLTANNQTTSHYLRYGKEGRKWAQKLYQQQQALELSRVAYLSEQEGKVSTFETVEVRHPAMPRVYEYRYPKGRGFNLLSPMREAEAGLKIISPKSNLTSEFGTSLEIGVQLKAAPWGEVVVTVQSSDETEGRVNRSQLVMNRYNWQEPQNVVVSGVDDEEADGVQDYEVLLTGVSGDPTHNDSLTVPLRNADGKLAGHYIIHTNATVTDSKTGLMWQQKENQGTYEWRDAIAFCEELNFAGYQDWRLPSIDELKGLIDESHHPTIHPEAFPLVQSSYYWSSTPDAGSSDDAWFVGFGNGRVYGYNKDSLDYVRCVRGGR